MILTVCGSNGRLLRDLNCDGIPYHPSFTNRRTKLVASSIVHVQSGKQFASRLYIHALRTVDRWVEVLAVYDIVL